MAAYCIGAGTLTSTAYAQTTAVYEVEPNDTMDTAQELEPNQTTTADNSAGTEKVNMLYGKISLGDQDWYKVYFQSGKQYISLSSGENGAFFQVSLYKENGELIDEWLHDESYKGSVGYDYDVTKGYHYVKITGVTSYSGGYNLSVGDSRYYTGGDKLTLDSVTMSGGTAKTVSFNRSDRLDIPKMLLWMPTGRGFADIVFLPLPHTKTPAIVVELKYDKNANTAIRQIKDCQYTQALEEYNGEILLVGINYDKSNENKPHSCIIEKLQEEHTC